MDNAAVTLSDTTDYASTAEMYRFLKRSGLGNYAYLYLINNVLKDERR